MRAILLLLLSLSLCSCAASRDAGTALEVTSKSTASQARLWPAVRAIVRSVATEHGLRRESVVRRPPPVGVVEWYGPPPHQSHDLMLSVSDDQDRAKIEIIEIGVPRPSPKHREILRVLDARLEAAGLIVTRSKNRPVVTY